MSDNTLASYQCQVLPLELIWKLLPSVMDYITHVLCCVVLCCVVLCCICTYTSALSVTLVVVWRRGITTHVLWNYWHSINSNNRENCLPWKGVIVVLRAVISESSTNTNQAFGFSVLTFSWMSAAMMAPLFSGLSADPIGQYNLTLSSKCCVHV